MKDSLDLKIAPSNFVRFPYPKGQVAEKLSGLLKLVGVGDFFIHPIRIQLFVL